jgi:hypothetical protein
MAAPFRCVTCGPLECIHVVETVVSWTEVGIRDGAVIHTSVYTATGKDRYAEYPACSGPIAMADGSDVVVEDWP